jgi:hypothetical protein
MLDTFFQSDHDHLCQYRNSQVCLSEADFDLDHQTQTDWLFNVEDQFLKKIIIGRLVICEITDNNWESLIQESVNRVFLYTGTQEWISLTDNHSYRVEIGGVIRRVWIGTTMSLSDIFKQTSLEKILTQEGVHFLKNLQTSLKKTRIMYARCQKSMYLLDVLHRQHISKHKFTDNEIVAIKSVAGSGKTTTLLKLAHKHSQKKILYLAYNKSLITEIKEKLKQEGIKNMFPSTFDALLYRLYKNIHVLEDLNIVELKPQFIGQVIDWLQQKPFKIREFYCKKFTKFCNDASENDIKAFSLKHFGVAKPLLEKLWTQTKQGQLITFETIRKQAFINHWFKGYIDKHYDMIMVDETQDFDMIMLQMILNDTTIPKLFVGDPQQSIYQFRGCINAFDHLPAKALTIEFYSTFRIGNPACEQIRDEFSSCWMISKSPNQTQLVNQFSEQDEYTHLFRSWRVLLETAEVTQDIWIYTFDKKINEIRNLHTKLLTVKNLSNEEGLFEDDLPKFLKSLTAERLEQLLNNISNNVVSVQECRVKMYTVHSYKGLEDDHIRVAPDINLVEDPHIYYVAITRGMKSLWIERKPEKESLSDGDELVQPFFETQEKKTPTLKKIIKSTKKKTDQITLELFLEGKTVLEISSIRSLKPKTVEEHIIKNLPHDDIPVSMLMTSEEYQEIEQQFLKNGTQTLLRTIKDQVSESISYLKIKAVKQLTINVPNGL